MTAANTNKVIGLKETAKRTPGSFSHRNSQPMPLPMAKDGTCKIVKMGGKTKMNVRNKKNAARVTFNQTQKAE